MQFHKSIYLCLIILLIFFTNTNITIASETKRPSANNKVGHTYKTIEERKNSIVNRMMNNEVFVSEDSEKIKQAYQINSNELVINQIKTLSELKRDGFLSDEEFESKKALLLERIK